MRVIPRHLNTQLILLVSGILLATGAISGWVTALRQSNMLLANMREHSAVMVASFSDNAAHHLVVQDYAGLEAFLLNAAELPDIVRLQVCETDGAIVGDVEHLPGGKPHPVPGRSRLAPPARSSSLMTMEGGRMIIWAPVEAGALLGWIKATYSMDAIHDLQTTTWRNSLLLALFWVALSVILLFLIFRPTLRTIGRLTAFARRLDEHKGDQIEAAHRAVEIEELGMSLNYASTRLFTTQQQLIREWERLHVTLRSIHDGVIAADADGTVVFLNGSAEDLTGWPAVEAVGRQIGEIFRLRPSQPGGPAAGVLPDMVNSGSVLALDPDATLIAKNGRERSIAGNAAPIQDNGGTQSGMVIVFRDITGQKQVERKIRLLAAIVQSSDDAIIGKDLDGVITSWNRGAERIYGYTESEMIGRSVSCLVPADRADELRLILERIRAGEHIEHHETVRLRKDGHRLPVSITVSPIFAADNRVAAASTITRDMTESRQAEQRLALLNFALNNVLDEAYLINEQARFEYVNDQSCIALGYSRAELLGMNVSIIDPDFPNGRWAEHWGDLRERRSFTFEGRHKNRDGRIYPVEISANYFEYEGRGYNLALARDITERKQAEHERLANLKFFENMDTVNRAMQGAKDLDTMMSDVLSTVLAIFQCDRAYLMYPCDPEAAIWNVPMEHTRPEYPGVRALGQEMPMDAAVAETLRILLNADGPVNFGPGTGRRLPADLAERFGIRSSMAMALHPKTGKPWQFGIHQCSFARTWTQEEERLLREIGRRMSDGLTGMLAHRDLQKSEEFLDNIVENIPDMIFVKDASSLRFVRLNKAGEELLGYSRQELIGRNDHDFFPREEADFFASKDREVLDSRKLVDIEQETIDTRDLGERILHTKKIPILDKGGKPHYLLGISEDITERKRTEEALRRTNELLERVFSASQTMIAYLDRDFNFIRVNQAYAAADNRLPDFYPGKNHFALYPNAENEQIFRAVVSTGVPYAAAEKPFVYSEHPERGMSYWDWALQPVEDADGSVAGLVLILQNVTARRQAALEREKLEQQLRQAQKMEAIGTLAGGVAHDFNNILTAIIGYSNIMKLKMKPDDPLRSAVDQVLTSSDRAAHLTQGLLAFSRKQVINPRPVDLNDIVRNIKKLLLRLIREDIELSTQLAGTNLIVMADAGQIEQVLMNLATNARDAMPEGGALSISTEEIELGEDFITAHGYGRPGKYALIAVSDTGQGMDEQTREKIFEPFFTTKELGKGTGLGLAMVYGIIKQHEGAINVYSEPGKGTTFKIYLPLILTHAEEPAAETPGPPRGGTETILLAEDDREVRNLTMIILKEFGYHVIEAVDGQDALDKFAAGGRDIDLLVLDVIMPRKSGREVYDAVKAARPDVDVLFMSGYTADIIHKKGIFEEGLNFLSKPISPFALLQKIRDILDRHRQAGAAVP